MGNGFIGTEYVTYDNVEIGILKFPENAISDQTSGSRYWRFSCTKTTAHELISIAGLMLYYNGSYPDISSFTLTRTDAAPYYGAYNNLYAMTDNNDSTLVVFDLTGTSNPAVFYIDLGVGRAVTKVKVLPQNSGGAVNRINVMTISKSDDAVSWTTVTTINDTMGPPNTNSTTYQWYEYTL